MKYLTISEEVSVVADRLSQHFTDSGFKVTVEPAGAAFPYQPTLRCSRDSTIILVEVVETYPDILHVQEWEAYCKLQGRDFRFAIGMEAPTSFKTSVLSKLTQMGIGIIVVEIKNGFNVLELCSAKDQNLTLSLPSLKNYSNGVLKGLSSALSEYPRDVMKGFDDACVVFEQQARRYLAKRLSSGLISFVTAKGNPKLVTKTQINKMTMGQLTHTFGEIVSPNHWDSSLERILRQLNDDRILVAHHRTSPRSRRRIRSIAVSRFWLLAVGLEIAQQ